MFEGSIVKRHIKIIGIALLLMLSAMFMVGGTVAVMPDVRVVPAGEATPLILDTDPTAGEANFSLAFSGEWPASERVALIAADSPFADHEPQICLLDAGLKGPSGSSSVEQSRPDHDFKTFDYHLANAVASRIRVNSIHLLTPSAEIDVIPLGHCFLTRPEQPQTLLETLPM